MTRILFVDDEPINHQLVKRALETGDYELHFSENGRDAVAMARNIKPDMIITDVMMPEINGYEVTRLLRREPEFSFTPILVLTAQSGLKDKLKSFEAGADDHLTKPFDPEELSARVASLLRRAERSRVTVEKDAAKHESMMIAVHSLRGGIGASSLAVNLGIGLAGLWGRPSILLDLTMTAGQVALMLNMTLRRTWADIARFTPGQLDEDAVESIVSRHESGLDFIPAPTFPSQAETLQGDTLGTAIRLIGNKYEYVVADLPHDFSEPAIQALDAANLILVLASPDMASIRAVTAAMDTYMKLGYPKEKIKLVLNAIFPCSALAKEKIEAALGLNAFANLPFVQDVFVDAINLGQPILFAKPDLPISGLLEDLAFHLSLDTHKKSRPATPSEAWKRVYKRYQERKR